MSYALYGTFVLTVIALMLIPGPNVALIVATSLSRGTRAGLATVAGTCAAMIPQLALTALGMSAFLGQAARAFSILRWIGVAYLVWLAYRAFTSPAHPPSPSAQPRPSRIFLRGFAVSMSNPKTLFFFAAFLPQFVDPRSPVPAQLLLLSMTFLAVAALIDSGWAVMAARLGNSVTASSRMRNRLSGGILLGAGIGLAVTRKP